MKYFLLVLLAAISFTAGAADIPVQRNFVTTNAFMNAPSDGWIAIWNNTAKKWSNGVNVASSTNLPAYLQTATLTNLAGAGLVAGATNASATIASSGGKGTNTTFWGELTSVGAAFFQDIVRMSNNVIITGDLSLGNYVNVSDELDSLRTRQGGSATLTNLSMTGAVTNKWNAWQFWSDPVETNVYHAENRGLGIKTNSVDFAALLQSVLNRGTEGFSFKFEPNPFFTNAYVISNTVIVTNWGTWSGDLAGNPTVAFRAKTNLAGPMFQIGAYGMQVGGISGWRDIRFEGDQGATNCVGVELRNVVEPIFAFCEFTGFKAAGIKMASTNAMYWTYVDNCWFVQKWDSSQAITFAATPIENPQLCHFRITGCTIGGTAGNGIIVSNWIANVNISGNKFFGIAMNDGIGIYAGERFEIANNSFQNLLGQGVYFYDQGSATNFNSSVTDNIGNVILGDNVRGVFLSGNNFGFGAESLLLVGNNGPNIVNFDSAELRLGFLALTNRVLYADSEGRVKPVSGSSAETEYVKKDGTVGTPSGGSGSTNMITFAAGSGTVTNGLYLGLGNNGILYGRDHANVSYHRVFAMDDNEIVWGTNGLLHSFRGTEVSPLLDNTTKLGDAAFRWNQGHFVDLSAQSVTISALTASRPLILNASGNVTNATGTPDGTKFLRDDGTLAVPAGGALSTNANQFGASTTLTIASGALLTNLQARGLTPLGLTASRPAFINASGNLTNATGTPDGTKFLRDDGTLAVPTANSEFVYTNLSDGNWSLNLSNNLVGVYTNMVTGDVGDLTLTLNSPVKGRTFIVSFVGSGTDGILRIYNGVAGGTVTWASTNNTIGSANTNLIIKAQKRTLLYGLVDSGTNGFTTNITVWAVTQGVQPSGNSSSNFITSSHGSIYVTNSVTAGSFTGTGTGVPIIKLQTMMSADNAFAITVATNRTATTTNIFDFTSVAVNDVIKVHSSSAGQVVWTNGPSSIYTPVVVSGVGGANTNFTLLSYQPEVSINGFTNISIRAAMGYDAATVAYWTCVITNGSGSARTLEFSAVTNNWRFNGVYGTNAPNTLTNATRLEISGRQHGTNVQVVYGYTPWP